MEINGGKMAIVSDLVGEHYILVEPLGLSYQSQMRDFLIKVEYLDPNDIMKKD